MSFDLSQHMPVPSDDATGFVEAGHRFKAWQPAGETARHVLVIQAWKEGDEDWDLETSPRAAGPPPLEQLTDLREHRPDRVRE
jgi:hypothetical protein